MKLIVGLGNPEPKYDGTRHNIGFMAINHYVNGLGEKFKTKFNGQYIQTTVSGEKVIFLKPDTFMNLSGEAVIKYMNFFDIAIEDVLIIYDDLDLDFAKIRIKQNSSHGGHNGIKSIINHLKSKAFLRVKLGINNEYKRDVKNFVLGTFNKNEQQQLPTLWMETDKIIEDFINGYDSLELMNKYN